VNVYREGQFRSLASSLDHSADAYATKRGCQKLTFAKLATTTSKGLARLA
jgi:hypothetical protein